MKRNLKLKMKNKFLPQTIGNYDLIEITATLLWHFSIYEWDGDDWWLLFVDCGQSEMAKWINAHRIWTWHLVLVGVKPNITLNVCDGFGDGSSSYIEHGIPGMSPLNFRRIFSRIKWKITCLRCIYCCQMI